MQGRGVSGDATHLTGVVALGHFAGVEVDVGDISTECTEFAPADVSELERGAAELTQSHFTHYDSVHSYRG